MGGLSLINVAQDGAMWWAAGRRLTVEKMLQASSRNARYNPWSSELKQSGPHPLPTAVPLGFICPKKK